MLSLGSRSGETQYQHVRYIRMSRALEYTHSAVSAVQHNTWYV